MKIADLREEYSRQELNEESVAADPVQQFGTWFTEALAAQIREPNAMTLSTVSADGQPHGRIVLLKGLESGRFVFFTNYNSHKGAELSANGRAALTFFWPELERQVRIEGTVSKISEKESETYFHSRPLASQIGAWASQQSEVIESRSWLVKKMEEYTAKFEGRQPIPKPPHWGGYAVDPHRIEFWQGRPSRLHDRIVFERKDVSWGKSRLSP